MTFVEKKNVCIEKWYLIEDRRVLKGKRKENSRIFKIS
jgi:hypothetical protein